MTTETASIERDTRPLVVRSRLAQVALFGLGLVIFNTGHDEATETLSRVGVLGLAIMAAAAALFFGNDTFASLARLLRGEGGLGDLLATQSSIYSVLISIGAALASAFFLYAAITGNPEYLFEPSCPGLMLNGRCL